MGFAELKMSEIRRANDCAVVLFQQQQSEMFCLLCSLCRRQEKQRICKAVIFQTFPIPVSAEIWYIRKEKNKIHEQERRKSPLGIDGFKTECCSK